MKYDLLLFDLDDTILDFKKSEAVSFQLAMSGQSIAGDLKAMYSYYREISIGLWRKVERNEISKDKLKVQRYEMLMEKYGFTACAKTLSESYLHQLTQNVFVIDQAVEICRELHDKIEIGAISNGIASVQAERLQRSGLNDFLSFTVVSEDCGFPKPDKRIFEYALKKAKGPAKKVLVVGDRLEADIAGAANAGMDSCWFNPNGQDLPVEYKPTYQITRLSELRDILMLQAGF